MDTFLNMLTLNSITHHSPDRLSPSCFDVFSRDEESKRNNPVPLRFLIISRLAAISVKHYAKTIPFSRGKEFLYSLKIFIGLVFACHSFHTN